jgi:Holliday junction resolvase RusA-like endonuclease
MGEINEGEKGKDKKGIDKLVGMFSIEKIPSTNKLFGHYRGKTYLYPEYKIWRERIINGKLRFEKEKIGNSLNTLKKVPLIATLIFGITKSYKRRDVDNMCKFIIDTIIQGYGVFDDKQIVDLHVCKRKLINSSNKISKDGDEYIFYTIEPFVGNLEIDLEKLKNETEDRIE